MKLNEAIKYMLLGNQEVASSMLEGDFYDVDFKAALKDVGIIATEEVESHGSSEGGNVYSIWKFETADQTAYIRFNGYYASFNGFDYEGFEEVELKETVTKTWQKV